MTTLKRFLVVVGLSAFFVAIYCGLGTASSPSYTLIGKGGFGSTKWYAFLERPPRGEEIRSGMCLSVVLDAHPISETYECGTVTAGNPWLEEDTGGQGKSAVRVYVAIFSPDTRKVAFTVKGHASRKEKIRRLSDAKARELGIPAVGYLTLAVPKRRCVQRIVSFGSSGAVLSDTGLLPEC